MIVFISSGFLLAGVGTLMFSSLWFVLASMPFGIVFAFFSNALLQAIKQKKKTTTIKLKVLNLLTMITLIIILYYFFMTWVVYIGFWHG
jgi:hypothetical protein